MTNQIIRSNKIISNNIYNLLILKQMLLKQQTQDEFIKFIFYKF